MRRCLHCDRKIGFLRKPVDGVFCSIDCHDRAIYEAREREYQRAIEEEAALERDDALYRAEERERLENEAARLRATSDVVLRPDLDQAPCPKCGDKWRLIRGGGSFGRDRGHCPSCGFHSEFLSIEHCENCRCTSLVVESDDDARCPRCKSRPRRRRQIA
jgi:hypothetical protein